MTTSNTRDQIGAVLLRSWDPLAGTGDADLERRRAVYIDAVVSMLAAGANDRQVAEYLIALETQTLGYQDSHHRLLRPLAKKLRLLYRRLISG